MGGSSEEIIASDGLRARKNGSWAKQKLSFLGHFGPPALMATRRKLQRYYLDLFAGPGRNVNRHDRHEEFEGSPIRALKMCAPGPDRISFTDAIFVNADERDHEALLVRVERLVASGECLIPRSRIRVIHGDANFVLPSIMRTIHPLAYALAFADIEAPSQLPWETVCALKRMGHNSVDLYMLFPLQMAILRLLAYDQSQTDRFEASLTSFFGNEEWKAVAGMRITDAQSPELHRALEALYIKQLETQWEHAGSIMDVRMRGRRYLYKMLFASEADAGKKIAAWAKRQSVDADEERRGQYELL